MRIATNPEAQRYVRLIGILLIAVVLTTAGTACDETYRLTISSTSGGSVTAPAEGTTTHEADTVVQLVATPDDGYRFVSWTGDVGTIANPNSASTTITMNGDYSVTANFSEDNGSGANPIQP
jgi:uncharacterized repeat protein (TIGR02543 family)